MKKRILFWLASIVCVFGLLGQLRSCYSKNPKMGGFVILLKREQVAQALVSFVKEYGITHVIRGHPGKRRFRLFDRPLHDELMREIPRVDLVIV